MAQVDVEPHTNSKQQLLEVGEEIKSLKIQHLQEMGNQLHFNCLREKMPKSIMVGTVHSHSMKKIVNEWKRKTVDNGFAKIAINKQEAKYCMYTS